MGDQRCSLPPIKPTDNSISPKKDEGAPHSASFSTKSNIEKLKNKDKKSPKEVYNSATLLKYYIKLQDLEYMNNGPSAAALTASNALFPPSSRLYLQPNRTIYLP